MLFAWKESESCFIEMASKRLNSFNPLSANFTKLSNTQTIRRQITNELFECVWPFCGIGAQRVKRILAHCDALNKTIYLIIFIKTVPKTTFMSRKSSGVVF